MWTDTQIRPCCGHIVFAVTIQAIPFNIKSHRVTMMNNQVGLWIDHREAFVVFADNENEEIDDIKSGMEKHVRFSMSADGKADDQRDRQFQTHLNQYYDKVIKHISTAKSIFIFGPGEAKVEFKKRLEGEGMGGLIVGVETVDKMTPNQIEAKIQQHFKKRVY